MSTIKKPCGTDNTLILENALLKAKLVVLAAELESTWRNEHFEHCDACLGLSHHIEKRWRRIDEKLNRVKA